MACMLGGVRRALPCLCKRISLQESFYTWCMFFLFLGDGFSLPHRFTLSGKSQAEFADDLYPLCFKGAATIATFVLADDFGEDLGKKVHNLSSDSIILMLSNTAPVQTTVSVYTDITQIATGFGYTQFSGANTDHALDTVTYAETSAGSGVWRWSSADEVFTAAGGSIATFRYIIAANNTDAAGSVIGYLDYGSAVDVTTGNTFTVDVGANGWFELTIP